jgi:DNA-binding PadR family transcriptional regulator
MGVRMTQATAMVLQAVAAGHRYGFDIMDATGLHSGTVYPILRRLEDAGLLRGRWENVAEAHRSNRPQRRFYEITQPGSEFLARALGRLARTRSFLDSLGHHEEA